MEERTKDVKKSNYIIPETPKDPKEFKEAFKKMRHKAELPIYGMAVALTVFIALFLIIGGIGFSQMEVTELEAEFLAGGVEAETAMTLAWAMNFIGPGLVILVLAFFGIIFLYGLYYHYAKVIAYAIKVTPDNFPEIYELAQQYTKILGLKKVPDVYIAQENGVVNAFASWVIGRNYVKLNAEIVDVAYMENKDLEPVKFIMGHEFGHIYLHHVQLIYKLGSIAWERIPILGNLLSRAREYSCDRVSQLLTGADATYGMALLTGGRHLYSYVNSEDYVDNILKEHNFFEKVGYFAVNLFASHPIMPYRTAAILDPERKSGRLL